MIFKTLVLLVAFIWSASSLAADTCRYKYRSHDSVDLRICSQFILSTDDVAHIKLSVHEALQHYPDYLKKSGYRDQLKPPPKLVKISIRNRADLNGAYLPNDGKNAIGRYLIEKQIIYIDVWAIKNRTSTVHHEVAHFLNHSNGISEEDEDEYLAANFEDYVANLRK